MLFLILFSRLIKLADKINIKHLCRVWRNRQNTDQIFYIHQVLERNGTGQQLFVDFREAYDTFQREVFYSSVTESDISTKQIRKTKIYLSKAYSKVRARKYLSEVFSIENRLKQGVAISSSSLRIRKNCRLYSERN
jgi:hypothetical protein